MTDPGSWKGEVYVVGLTGGMGSGKSTVARMLAELGAEVIDADRIAREVVEPGQPALAAILGRFGAEVLRPDGSLDREALAAIVFADDDARADLEAITHPRIHARIRERLDAEDAAIVVLDHPLLVETGQHEDVDAVVVVTAPLQVRVERLAAGRGIDREDAHARIRAQTDDDARLAVADHVVDNGGDVAHLERQVRALWDDLLGAAAR